MASALKHLLWRSKSEKDNSFHPNAHNTSRAGASHGRQLATFQVGSSSHYRKQIHSPRRPRSRTRSTHDSRARSHSRSHERSHRRSYSQSHGRAHSRPHRPEDRAPRRSNAYCQPSYSHQEPWYFASNTPQYVHPRSVPSPQPSGYTSPYRRNHHLVATPRSSLRKSSQFDPVDYYQPSYYGQQQPTPYMANDTPHYASLPGVMQSFASAGSTSTEYAARNASMASAHHNGGSRSHGRYYGITEGQLSYHNSLDTDVYASSYSPRAYREPPEVRFGGIHVRILSEHSESQY